MGLSAALGEVGLSPVAPASVNALLAASGKRVGGLPVSVGS